MALAKNATLAELATYYLDNVVKGNYADSTYKSYTTRLAKYVLPKIGTKQVVDLRKLDVQNLIFGLNETTPKISASTIRLVQSVLHKILDFAVDLEITGKNTSDRVILPKQVKFQPKICSEAEIQSILKASEGSILHMAILLAANTGLRRSEILGLQWGDINLCNQTITVRKATTGRTLGRPKTKWGYRSLKVSVSLSLALQDYRSQQCSIVSKSDGIENGKAFLISKPDGSQYSPSYISHKFKELLQENNLPAIRFHDLRVAYATYAHYNGMPIKDLSRSLGHSSAACTLDNYVVHIGNEYIGF